MPSPGELDPARSLRLCGSECGRSLVSTSVSHHMAVIAHDECCSGCGAPGQELVDGSCQAQHAAKHGLNSISADLQQVQSSLCPTLAGGISISTATYAALTLTAGCSCQALQQEGVQWCRTCEMTDTNGTVVQEPAQSLEAVDRDSPAPKSEDPHPAEQTRRGRGRPPKTPQSAQAPASKKRGRPSKQTSSLPAYRQVVDCLFWVLTRQASYTALHFATSCIYTLSIICCAEKGKVLELQSAATPEKVRSACVRDMQPQG